MPAKSLIEPLTDELVDQRFAEPFDVHRRAGREVLQAAPDPRRARRVLAAPDHFLVVAAQRTIADRTRAPASATAPRASGCGRIGLTTFGMTSPPFSMSTRSPSRRSLRATSSALWRVAIEIVEPASRTGSSTAYGVTAPVRPTLTSIFRRIGRRLLRRKLEGGGPPRKLGGRAKPLAQRQIVDLDDHAVGVEVERAAAVRPLGAERSDLVDAVTRAPMGLDRQPPGPHRGQHPGMTGANTRQTVVVDVATLAADRGRDQLIREARQPALRHGRRVEIPHGSGGGVSRVGERRQRRRPGARDWCVRTTRAAGRPRRAPRSVQAGRFAGAAESPGWYGRSPSRPRRGAHRRASRHERAGRPRRSAQCSGRQSSAPRRIAPSPAPSPALLRTRSSNARSSSSE